MVWKTVWREVLMENEEWKDSPEVVTREEARAQRMLEKAFSGDNGEMGCVVVFFKRLLKVRVLVSVYFIGLIAVYYHNYNNPDYMMCYLTYTLTYFIILVIIVNLREKIPELIRFENYNEYYHYIKEPYKREICKNIAEKMIFANLPKDSREVAKLLEVLLSHPQLVGSAVLEEADRWAQNGEAYETEEEALVRASTFVLLRTVAADDYDKELQANAKGCVWTRIRRTCLACEFLQPHQNPFSNEFDLGNADCVQGQRSEALQKDPECPLYQKRSELFGESPAT
jgi:hypothetical protein